LKNFATRLFVLAECGGSGFLDSRIS